MSSSLHRCIAVRSATEQYDIHIGPGVMAQVGTHVGALTRGRKAFIVSHPQLYKLYGASLSDTLQEAGFSVETCLVPEGERSKTLLMASRLFTRLARAGADRQSVICAFGGGVIGDLAGFVAATYMRGIPLVQIPSSLLAMVDSSVGGKTAVNHKLGKNLIGAFYPARAVFTDTNLLQSLPEREYLCGLSEIVKAGIIGDIGLFEFIEQHIAAIRRREEAAITTLIERAIAVKVRVVEEDPLEKGVRAILNFGHTLGHALEAVTTYDRYSHGEAVAVGMALVAILSERLGYCSAAARSRVCAAIEALGLPTTYDGIAAERLLEAMTHDKKSLNGVVRFILLKDIGDVAYHQQVPLDTLRPLLEQYA
ncbi:MAG: 3-dehydroquinate synthase [Candidatus Tectimicrobiota bacterium]